MPKILFNGKTYDSVDDLPPESRAAYQKALEFLHDTDKNGVPDFLEGKPMAEINNVPLTVDVQTGTNFIVGDKVYTNLDELPPEARLKYDQAVAKLGPLMSDADGNGIPDIFEGKKVKPAAVNQMAEPPMVMDMPAGVSQNPPPSVISDVTPNYGVTAIIIIAALVVVGLLGLGVYLLLPMLK
jgi:hypothetical protein